MTFINSVGEDQYLRRPSTLSLSLGLDEPSNVIVARKRSSIRASIIPEVADQKDPDLGWRHIQFMLMSSAVLGLFTHRSCLSVAIVAMTSNTTVGTYETYEWSRQEQGTIFSAFLWGYAFTQIPAGFLTSHFGAKRLMGISLASSSLSLACIPLVASNFGWLGVAILRAFTGAIQGITYPGTYTLLGKWAVPQERGKASAFTITAHAAGNFVAMGLSGFITVYLDWPFVFYFFGAFTGAIAVLWFIFCSDSPDVHPWISDKERRFIVDAIGHESKKISNARTPWIEIVTSVPFLSLGVCHIGYVWGQWKVLTALPRYMNEMFEISLEMNGVISAAPYLFNIFVGIFSGWLSDVLINNDCVSTGHARKLFNSIGFWGPAVLFFAVPLTPNDLKEARIVELVLAVGLSGASYCGLMVNFVELSPRFSGLILALSNTVSNIVTAVALPISEAFVDLWGETVGWAAAFYLTAGVLLFTNLVWIIFGTSEKQPWNDVKENKPSVPKGS